MGDLLGTLGMQEYELSSSLLLSSPRYSLDLVEEVEVEEVPEKEDNQQSDSS